MKQFAQPRGYGSKAPSRASQGAALAMLLCGATEGKFSEFTVDYLCGLFPDLPRDQVEKQFSEAQARRAGCERGE